VSGADEAMAKRPQEASTAPEAAPAGRLRGLRRGARAGALAGALLAAAAAAWLGGLAWFAGHARTIAAVAESRTDAIVVLTGGSKRMAEGFRLLAADRAEKLFVSGVYQGVEVAQLLELAQRDPGELDCCVVLGYAADDTRGNAAETAAWMREEGFASLRLVTSNYHMPRSLLELRRALPDAAIVPHPVDSDRVHLDEWWAWPGTALLIATEWNKYLFARLRGPAGPLPPPEPTSDPS